METKKVFFKDREWKIETRHRYSPEHGGRRAVVLERTPDDYLVATVNMPEVPLADKEVLIKDYSENEGIKKVLTDAEIIKPIGVMVPSGYVEIEVCELLYMQPEV